LSGIWKEKDILIIVKAYPEYSTKYIETVCTCGVMRDTGQREDWDAGKKVNKKTNQG
jgi:hypothetical protein